MHASSDKEKQELREIQSSLLLLISSSISLPISTFTSHFQLFLLCPLLNFHKVHVCNEIAVTDADCTHHLFSIKLKLVIMRLI